MTTGSSRVHEDDKWLLELIVETRGTDDLDAERKSESTCLGCTVEDRWRGDSWLRYGDVAVAITRLAPCCSSNGLVADGWLAS